MTTTTSTAQTRAVLCQSASQEDGVGHAVVIRRRVGCDLPENRLVCFLNCLTWLVSRLSLSLMADYHCCVPFKEVLMRKKATGPRAAYTLEMGSVRFKACGWFLLIRAMNKYWRESR